jgi:hypothetical protein
MPAPLARTFRFDERLANHEDWDLLLRLLRSGARYLYCHEPLASYWNAPDPTRITKRPSLEPTLYWLRTAGDLIAADAAATYYFRAIFKRHFAGSPGDALLTGLRLALRSPRAAWWVTRKTLSTLGERSGLEPGNRKR